MVFNSIHFALFFLVFYTLYRALPRRPQNWLLLAASYYFYAAWDWRFLGLIVATTGVNFLCGRLMASGASDRRRRSALYAGVLFGLVVLGFFKYFGFFAENLRALLALAGWRVDAFTLHVLLPIGISFYTFTAMSYVIDVYRRQIEPTTDLLGFAVFVAFFPTVLAGPILRAGQMLPQLASRRVVSRGQIREGLWLILWGLAKKMFMADNLAPIASAAFASGADPAGFEVLLAVYAYAFQIYGDFSGYSDIARGLSKLMGLELPVNFRHPYFVKNAQAFWQHWHITLSTWLRDYLFLPLSFAFSRRLDGVRWLGLRDDVWIYAAATLVTMLLAGLWHGAAWTFVLWGLYQGVLLVAFRIAGVARRQRRRSVRRGRRGRLAAGLSVLAMFHLTCLGWLVFRAESVGQIGALAARLVTVFQPTVASWNQYGWALLFYTVPLLIVHALEAWRDDLAVVVKLPALARYSICGVLVYLILLFGNFTGAQFIYFQF